MTLLSPPDETHAEIVARLRLNWQRYGGRQAEVLMRAINATSSGEAFFWSGIERDLVVYAMARTLGEDKP